jgi:hypothetical protein
MRMQSARSRRQQSPRPSCTVRRGPRLRGGRVGNTTSGKLFTSLLMFPDPLPVASEIMSRAATESKPGALTSTNSSFAKTSTFALYSVPMRTPVFRVCSLSTHCWSSPARVACVVVQARQALGRTCPIPRYVSGRFRRSLVGVDWRRRLEFVPDIGARFL